MPLPISVEKAALFLTDATESLHSTPESSSNRIMDTIEKALGAFRCMYDRVMNFRCVVKDRQHRYLYVNPGWLLSQSISSPDEVLGKTALNIFPAWRAERYMQEEREVMEKRKHLDYLDYSVTASGVKERWRNLKAPWILDGNVVGLTNIAMLIEPRAFQEKRGDAMPWVIDWMTQYASQRLTIAEIADQCNMSQRTLERYFKKETGESPSRYRLLCRIRQAKELLADPAMGLTEIADECGFYDQSHFTREFTREVGVSPSRWRKR
jgi:AraC-like DNA-binding protein